MASIKSVTNKENNNLTYNQKFYNHFDEDTRLVVRKTTRAALENKAVTPELLKIMKDTGFLAENRTVLTEKYKLKIT